MADHPLSADFEGSGIEHSSTHLGEALMFVRAAITNCERAGLSREVTSAALAVELVPRLIAAFGVHQAKLVLRQIMAVAEEDESNTLHQ